MAEKSSDHKTEITRIKPPNIHKQYEITRYERAESPNIGIFICVIRSSEKTHIIDNSNQLNTFDIHLCSGQSELDIGDYIVSFRPLEQLGLG